MFGGVLLHVTRHGAEHENLSEQQLLYVIELLSYLQYAYARVQRFARLQGLNKSQVSFLFILLL